MRRTTVDARRWVFDLSRHDPEPPAPQDPPAPEPPKQPDPPAPTDPPKQPAPNGFPENTPLAEMSAEQRESYWKHQARKHEDRYKGLGIKDSSELEQLRQKAAKLDEIEEGQKTEAEKLAARAEAAEKRAADAVQRSVKSEVKVLAVDTFADPSDAEAAIDPADYVDANGQVNTAGIKQRLAELLEAKPHWRKPTGPTTPPAPKPDPGQGARPEQPPTNFKDASPEDFAAELAKYGVKPRSA